MTKTLTSVLGATVKCGPVAWSPITGLVNKENYEALKPVATAAYDAGRNTVKAVVDMTVENWNRDISNIKRRLGY